jgi:murein DD-endopeptidase MepM/ murein hydrolase activator NlpD
MVAGTDRARDLVDDESSPQLYAASQQFLAADAGIAEIARQKQVLVRLKQDATDTAQLYRAMGYDVAGAQRAASAWHERYDALPADAKGVDLRRVGDSATRADERLGGLVVARDGVKADFARIAARYEDAERQLADANARVTALAAQRSTALSAVQAAKGSDIALNQARIAESGQLGAQIESLSEQLAKRGATVDGTGRFSHPLDGVITSPFGMRFHPILHYTKLHTGTDFAGGSVIKAADDGRVLMTVVSAAYGNFTVIDHGMVDGKHLTTAYAHQARFLVKAGDVVRKGDPIGIVGQTGYATGPHLHFEVRENGTVVDPVAFLARH